MYKTETHLHTAESSSCGKLPAAEMIAAYHAAGYTTVFVTDHFTIKSFEKRAGNTWEEKLEAFFTGYRAAKAVGEPLGMHILLGAEIRFEENSNDYLLYGADEAFLHSCRDWMKRKAAEFLPFAHAHGVAVIQAHPMRDGKCTPNPHAADGFEVYNTSPRHENFCAETLEMANRHGLLITSGSDAHRPEDIARGGILTDAPITSGEEYIAALRGGNCRLLGAPDQI